MIFITPAEVNDFGQEIRGNFHLLQNRPKTCMHFLDQHSPNKKQKYFVYFLLMWITAGK